VCKHAPSRVVRHHTLNECVSCVFGTAGILVKTEPTGLAHKDGKRPDGCTLIPWHGRKPLAWFVSHSLHHSGRFILGLCKPCSRTRLRAIADRKCLKYTELSATYVFQPVAVETHGPLSISSVSLLQWSTWAARFLSMLVNHTKYSFYSSGSMS